MLTGEPAGSEGRPHSADVRTAPAAYFLAGLLAGFGLEEVLPVAFPISGSITLPSGGALLASGIVLLAVALLTLHHTGTAIDPMKESTVLITGGIYAFSRNPAYLGLSLIHAGLAILGRSCWTLAMLPPVVLLVRRCIIAREENYLRTVFGSAYADYIRKVRRWM
jgi:protein-S-isoprenylcysteine O-methyltransferase Ste14